MGGINSLSGLNKVNVDFRPAIETNVTKTADANRPQPAPAIHPDGSTVKVDNKIECVQDYNLRKCPSFFKREFFHTMFDKPE